MNKKYKMIQHCAVYGDLTTVIRHWETEPSTDNREKAMLVIFTEPRKQRAKYIQMNADNIRYTTIESIEDGSVLYDSRNDIPCDMEKWQETRQRFSKHDR
jgi:predicted alpha/beta hydrolase family esterase